MAVPTLLAGRKNGWNPSRGVKEQDGTLRAETVTNLEKREHCEVQLQNEAGAEAERCSQKR